MNSIGLMLESANIPVTLIPSDQSTDLVSGKYEFINTLVINEEDKESLDNVVSKWIVSGNNQKDKKIVLLTKKKQKTCTLDVGSELRLEKPVKKQLLFSILQKLHDKTHPLPISLTKEDLEIPPLKILLVEDNNMNQLLGMTLFKKRNHHVQCVNDGEEALKLIKNHTFDIIFLDLYMPSIDGFETAKQIRIMTRKHRAPWLVGLTSSARESDKEMAFESGMNKFLMKPLNAENIDQILHEYQTQVNLTHQS
jgi:CheY-like chemotaxis protein